MGKLPENAKVGDKVTITENCKNGKCRVTMQYVRKKNPRDSGWRTRSNKPA